VSINVRNYCTVGHSTFSMILDFPSAGGIADDSVVPNNSSIAVTIRNDLFMTARPEN